MNEEKVLHKLNRNQLNSYKIKLIREQNGICPISLVKFDLTHLENAVVDHDHITGEIRGVLDRSANACEGKVSQAVAKWGRCGLDYNQIIPYLERLVEYLKAEGKGVMYPFQKESKKRPNNRAKMIRELKKQKGN